MLKATTISRLTEKFLQRRGLGPTRPFCHGTPFRASSRTNASVRTSTAPCSALAPAPVAVIFVSFLLFGFCFFSMTPPLLFQKLAKRRNQAKARF